MALIIASITILLLIFLGMSIPFSFLSGSLLFSLITGASTGSYVSTAYYSQNSFGILAIPLFMAAGTLMERSGIARTLIDFAEVLLKKVKGGMGATIPVVACFFGALSGSGTATVTTLSTMMAPRLEELGWDKRYIAAFIAAAGPLGYMIPPNMNAILYTTVSSASVAALFLATIIPGLIWAALYIIINRVIYTKWYHPPENSITSKAAISASPLNSKTVESANFNEPKERNTKSIIRSVLPAFMMPVIIMGGIYGGVFTPTEAGGVGCLYALIVGIFIFKKMTFKQAFKSFIDTGSSLGSILIMMPMTLMFSRILVVNDVPQMVTTLITSISTNRTVILLIIDFIIFAAGFFLDAGILLLLFTPLLLPTAVMIGLSQVQLGVMMFVAVGIGTITPPMAMSLFITGKICKVTVNEMIKPLIPLFLFGALPILILVTFVPEASEFLPRLILGGN